jgi:hypothetical protein
MDRPSPHADAYGSSWSRPSERWLSAWAGSWRVVSPIAESDPDAHPDQHVGRGQDSKGHAAQGDQCDHRGRDPLAGVAPAALRHQRVQHSMRMTVRKATCTDGSAHPPQLAWSSTPIGRGRRAATAWPATRNAPACTLTHQTSRCRQRRSASKARYRPSSTSAATSQRTPLVCSRYGSGGAAPVGRRRGVRAAARRLGSSGGALAAAGGPVGRSMTPPSWADEAQDDLVGWPPACQGAHGPGPFGPAVLGRAPLVPEAGSGNPGGERAA